MCGIVGYVGKEQAKQRLLDGLSRLEYRGYDSAGIAVFDGNAIVTHRAQGKLIGLKNGLEGKTLSGCVGIGHTRWATHGKPSEINAHPHRAGKIVLVHNGIIENYRVLREQMQARGRKIVSETDTEIVAHLIDEMRSKSADFPSAVRKACRELEGSYALAVLNESDPERIVVAKNGGSPIILGIGEQEVFLASDIPAILPYTRKMIFLEDGDFADLSRNGVTITDIEGNSISRLPKQIQWDPVAAEKGGYDRFMQKEIFEQPRAITDTIGTRALEEQGDVDLDGIVFTKAELERCRRIYLVACGTAWHACLVGKYMIEQLARVPVEVDLASEFRYRRPILDETCLVIPVSQSGETADTLAALREGKRHGARVLAVCNVREATIARESDDVIYTQAGPEIGVASTKAFTTQVVTLYLIALKLARSKGTLDATAITKALHELLALPRLIEATLHVDTKVREIAQKYFHAQDFLFLGRGLMYPIALEGALKLKEISYIHAEGYAAGEMKHGPIALIDEKMPVVVIAERGAVYDKVISNLEEVVSREGKVIAIATQGDESIVEKVSDVIYIPDLGPYLTAILATIPLQLLAYHVATLKGTDVDQPRNLAKSVTVE